MKRLALIALVIAHTASADVWQHAIDAGSDPQQDVYDTAMRSGDELASQATAQAASREAIRALVQHAATSYRLAATLKPKDAEPYYRLGRLLYSFYFECTSGAIQMNPSSLCIADPSYFDRKHAEEVIAAWTTFEKLAPLDPRLGVMREDGLSVDFQLLFHRAVLHTRLAGKVDLEAATHDYEEILARADQPDETVLGNLAETYMMLGRLDDSIDTYREALRTGLRSETVYGLAIALDRDERGGQARDLILSQGEQAVTEFEKKVRNGDTFFVPAGEEYYYFALIYESFAMDENAIEYWQKYIQSGAHPEFRPRAKAHLETLLADKKKKVLKLESPWHDLFR
jgi:tetratricopeptide (TPR) repeat protein